MPLKLISRLKRKLRLLIMGLEYLVMDCLMVSMVSTVILMILPMPSPMAILCLHRQSLSTIWI
jgi:hypothetical protein